MLPTSDIRFSGWLTLLWCLIDCCNPPMSSVTFQTSLFVCGSENVVQNVWYPPEMYLNPIICPIRGCRPRSLIFSFTFTSSEITTPIRLLFPDILPSKLQSGWLLFFTSKCIILLFLLSNQHLPWGCVSFLSHFPLSTQSQNLLWTSSWTAMQAKDNKGSVPSSTPDNKLFIVFSSFLSFSIFVYNSNTMYETCTI